MDTIEQRQFMEGTISREVLEIWKEHIALGYCLLLLDNWRNRLVVKLLEATHGQWLYSKIQARDSVTERQ